MSVIGVKFIGRFGNQMFTYAFARGYAEAHGLELQTDPWLGQQIFEINDPPMANPDMRRRSDLDWEQGEKDFIIEGYCQNQKCLTYTREQAKAWFKLKPEIEKCLQVRPDAITAHRRVGDYAKCGYTVVSRNSYRNACLLYGYEPALMMFVSEEQPISSQRFQGELSFLPDWYSLLKASVLLRGNSSFSWWAATLGNARVFSPVIEGLEAGEQDAPFVEGNYPRFATLNFLTDLYLL